MFNCPKCSQSLIQKRSDYGVFWACESCASWLISIPILRRTLDGDFFNRFWQEVRASGEGQATACPSCSKPMNQLSLGTPEAPLEPLVCKACNFAWLTPEQRSSLPVPAQLVTPPPAEKTLAPEAAQAAAMLQVHLMAERAKNEGKYDASRVPVWQKALSVIGMPLESGSLDSTEVPRGTLLLTLVTLMVSAVFLLAQGSGASPLAFIPAQPFRFGGLTFFSNFLVHSGWFQLASNLYFLFLFGRSVEGEIQWEGLLSLVLLSAFGGNLTALCIAPKSLAPIQGASGGVAGILLFYGFVFPQRNLLFYFHGKFFPIPAWIALGLWVLFQVMGFFVLPSAIGGVSFAANLGGLLGGLIGWFFWKWKKGKGRVEAKT